MQRRAERMGFAAFRRTPTSIRQRIVRLIKPSFTVGVMPVVTRDDGAVLLVRHSYLDGWGLPGGLINRHEPFDQALLRETREEVGLAIELVGAPTVTLHPRHQIVRIVQRAKLAAGVDPATARPTSQEIVEVWWCPPDEIPSLLEEATGALAALRRSEAARSD